MQSILQRTNMKTDFYFCLVFLISIVDSDNKTTFPEFVTEVQDGPSANDDRSPTLDDINRFMMSTFAVGYSNNESTFPEFVTAVPHDPPVSVDAEPTIGDISRFMMSTFAVGNSYVSMQSNASAVRRMSSDFLETSRLPPRLDCYGPKDCAEVQTCGNTRSGVYRIYPFGIGDGFLVVCDLESLGGGWTVIQRRLDGSVDFNRHWDDYMAGFGNLMSEFWVGLYRINQMTSQVQTELAVRMSDYTGSYGWAKYEQFYVSDEHSKFRMFVRGYSGTAGDSLQLHSGMQFSTPDKDNDIAVDRHCGQEFGAGWWFGDCANANLNGIYRSRSDGNLVSSRNIMWYSFKKQVPLQWAEMRIRPAKFAGGCPPQN